MPRPVANAGWETRWLSGQNVGPKGRAFLQALETFERRSVAGRKSWETRIENERAAKEFPPVEPVKYTGGGEPDYDFDTDYYDVEEPMDSTGKKK